MSIIKYNWNTESPNTTPGIYTTCLSNERYTAMRWWDGRLWWDICTSRGRIDRLFEWPRGAAANGHRKPDWYHGSRLYLRAITDQGAVRWGAKYRHYEPNEVLQHLVATGRLPADWKERFQDEMRQASEKRAVGRRAATAK